MDQPDSIMQDFDAVDEAVSAHKKKQNDEAKLNETLEGLKHARNAP